MRGYQIKPQSIVSIKTADGTLIYTNKMLKSTKQILSTESSDLMNMMLQKAILEGTGASLNSVYGIQLPVAGKTGTSQNYADAWFAAYNPKLVMVTRVGASSPLIKFNSGSNGSGSKLALPLVAKTLQAIQKTTWLKKTYFTNFDTISEEIYNSLDCEDYTEDTGFEKFFESIFKSNKTTLEKAQKKAERKAKRKLRKEQRKSKKNSN